MKYMDGQLDALDQGGWAALHETAYSGSAAEARELVSLGANPNIASRGEGETPLHVASRRGFSNVVGVLIQGGANIEARTAGERTPLHVAIIEGHTGVAQQLLHCGADVHAQDDGGWTPLHFAVRLTSGIGCNEEGEGEGDGEGISNWRTKSLDLVRALLRAGADMEAATWVVDEQALTALHLAAISGNEDMVKLLLEEGAEPGGRYATCNYAGDVWCEEGGCQARDESELTGGDMLREGSVGVIEGVNVCMDTPLHEACRHLHEGCVRALLHAGANENAVGVSGKYPTDVIGLSADPGWKDTLEPTNRILLALQHAQADRAWACRGWLVMIRSQVQGHKGNITPVRKVYMKQPGSRGRQKVKQVWDGYIGNIGVKYKCGKGCIPQSALKDGGDCYRSNYIECPPVTGGTSIALTMEGDASVKKESLESLVELLACVGEEGIFRAVVMFL
ncbi:unnamed protein product [Choristocarpus tenellus]